MGDKSPKKKDKRSRAKKGKTLDAVEVEPIQTKNQPRPRKGGK